MAKTYPIKGIPLSGEGDIPTRQEITAWYNNENNKYQVSLFMQAMVVFKELPIEERLSYFQIAGIHCYPVKVGWDGDAPITEPVLDDPYAGYCNHNMVTFPTWHRPYMLLYEQALHGIMVSIIDDWKSSGLYPELKEDLWISGATQFRLPYWDFARKQAYDNDFSIPEICKNEYVNVLLPNNTVNKEFPNPLIKFQNPRGVPMGDASMGDNQILNDTIVIKGKVTDILPWSRCVGTSRFGINEDLEDSTWVDGKDDWEQVNQAMRNPLWYNKDGGSFSDAVSRMLSPHYFKSWGPFASTIWNDSSKYFNTHFLSLEYIHNVIHNTVGGGFKSASDAANNPGKGYQGIGLGHMSDVPVAAFDPIFWFHHCNIDRLTAIWQTFNGDKKWFDHPQTKGKYPDPKPSDPLRPFHYDEDSHHWTSDKCQKWTDLSYQYDDLVPGDDARNPDGTTNLKKFLPQLRKRIDDLYPPTGRQLRKIPHFIGENNKFDDYVINIIYDRYALNGVAYSILFFLGDPPEELATYHNSENFVGLIYTFSAPILAEEGCTSCATQQAAQILSKAQIPLTIPLLAKLASRHLGAPEGSLPTPGLPGGGLGWYSKKRAEVLLKDELQWRFVQLGGKVLLETDLPQTEIAVLRGVGHHDPEGTENGINPLFSGYERVEFDKKPEEHGHRRLGTKENLIHNDSVAAEED